MTDKITDKIIHPIENQVVYIVDDDEAMRDSLVWLLNSQGFTVQAYPTAEEFLSIYDENGAGCLLLDIRMPGMSGLELYECLNANREHRPSLPVIFITGHGDVPMAVSALKKGAVDFIEKPFDDKEILHLIQQCFELDRTRRGDYQRLAEAEQRLTSLTAREKEVVTLIIAGKLNKQIADELDLSIKTVEVHRSRLMDKMGVRTVAELVQAIMHTAWRP